MNLRRLCKPEKKLFARRMRFNPTAAEALLWDLVREKKIEGVRFRRQSIIRGYIADFWCPSAKLIVEADGSAHDALKDAHRDMNLARLGILTVRFTNDEILNSPEHVIKNIAAIVRERIVQ